jgi:uncharacterized protein involved in response to NO
VRRPAALLSQIKAGRLKVHIVCTYMAVMTIRDSSIRRPAPGGMVFLSAGFRPFFLLACVWAALAVPVWLGAYVHGYAVGGALGAMAWHAHEMVYGFGVAAVAGFLLTAIPNWTGRLPVRGAPLGALAGLWLGGRLALFILLPLPAALIDLAFLPLLMALVARELIAGRNYRNLPMLAALGLLFAGNVLVHLHALDLAYTARLGNSIGIATLLALISLVGGRIIPSFTRNWLAKMRRDLAPPAQMSRLDLACLLVTLAGLVAWVAAPDATELLQVAAGAAVLLRLSRWRGLYALREPLLVVLHLGYAWLGIGLLLLGLGVADNAALHALTVGAIGTMTLAVMTRASLGHSGQPLRAGAGTTAIYGLVTLAAVLRVLAPYFGGLIATSLAGLAWSAAFGLFVILYGPLLLGKKT